MKYVIVLLILLSPTLAWGETSSYKDIVVVDDELKTVFIYDSGWKCVQEEKPKLPVFLDCDDVCLEAINPDGELFFDNDCLSLCRTINALIEYMEATHEQR